MADAASTSDSGTPTPASEPQPAVQDAPALEQPEDSSADTQPTPSPPAESPIPPEESLIPPEESPLPPADSPANPTPSFSNNSVVHNSKPSKASVECLSMQLDAFVLNKQIFTDKYFVAPLNVPDHSAFLPGAFSAPDVVPPVDLDSAYPWYRNSRIADVTKTSAGTDPEDQRLRKDRLGVYLHWCLPRRFRGAAPITDSETPPLSGDGDDGGDADLSEDDDDGDAEETGSATPGADTGKPLSEHAAVPDRWIIIRFVGQAKPVNPSDPPAPAVSAFIVESNRIRHLGRGDEFLDVELEAAPFINHKLPVEKQADVFLGMKRKFDDDWADPAPRGQYHSPLTLLDAGNPLFADFQHHNPNVFSIHDDLSWTNADGTETFHAAKATVSYAVFGYFSNSKEAKKLVCHGSLFHVEWDRHGKPDKIEAEGVSDVVREQQPIAVGQDTLEALETYLDTLSDRSNFNWMTLIREMKIVIDQAGRGAGMLDAQAVSQTLRSGFKPVNGGHCWRYNSQHQEQIGAVSHEKHEPTAEEMENMFIMDRYQAYIDALDREERYLRHSLFCEWWKKRCQTPGGMWETEACRAESSRRIREATDKLERIKSLKKDFNKQRMPHFADLTATARPSFFSRHDPTILLGGLGTAWPSEFLNSKQDVGRDLNKLPFRGEDGKRAIQQWLKSLLVPDTTDLCTQHGMKLFFESAESMAKLNEGNKENPDINRMQELFTSMDNMQALHWAAPGWVREAVEALMQEWVYLLNKQPIENLSPPPTYCQDQEVRWRNTQPWRALFVEWELEYYHLPKRFWRLEKEADGTAQYKIAPDVNISAYDGMDRQRRTVSGRSLLRPNAGWVLTTLLAQLFAKLDKNVVEARPALATGANDILLRLQEALRKMNLLVGNLEGFTDNLLTLNRGTHVIPDGTTTEAGMDPADADLVRLLCESPDGFDVTPYRESSFSAFGAVLDFKPVTHGQARFTKFNIVDKFGQVVSPLLTPTPVPGQAQGGGGGGSGHPGAGKDPKLYPCIGRSLACQPNVAEGPGFANSIELDADGKSQYFQLGHRINQDARLNTYFVVNSADWRSHHPSTQWYRGDPPADGSGMGSKLPPQHMWRPTTEYEDPVWGWLVIDFRDRGIQVYNAAGESMGEALLPGTLGGTVVWQAYYAEGDLGTTEDFDDGSQLRELMRLMDDPKYLFGLWSVLADACQNIQPAPAGSGGGSGGDTALGSAAGGVAAGSTFGDGRLLNLVGRPMALVNVGMSLELATPAMQTQSYADLRKRAAPGGDEIALEDYQFEVLLGDKTNLNDGLVGYFVPPPTTTTTSPSPGPLPHPDLGCLYTPFGYPSRNDLGPGYNNPSHPPKSNTFSPPSSHRLFLRPHHPSPSDHPTPTSYTLAHFNHPTTSILTCLIDPSQPLHIATGILPTTTLSLPRWIVARTLARLRLLFRGGPMLIRGDLPSEDNWARPLNQTERVARGVVPLTPDAPGVGTKGRGEEGNNNMGGGSRAGWLQPVLDDRCVDNVPVFVPYNLADGAGGVDAAGEWPLLMGPHTCLEGFYKMGLLEMEAREGNLLPEKPVVSMGGPGGDKDPMLMLGGELTSEDEQEKGEGKSENRRETPASARYRLRGLA